MVVDSFRDKEAFSLHGIFRIVLYAGISLVLTGESLKGVLLPQRMSVRLVSLGVVVLVVAYLILGVHFLTQTESTFKHVIAIGLFAVLIPASAVAIWRAYAKRTSIPAA